MADLLGEDSGAQSRLEHDLADARKRRAELRAELDQLDRRIEQLERQRRVDASPTPNANQSPPRAASAWDRALQTRRKGPGDEPRVAPVSPPRREQPAPQPPAPEPPPAAPPPARSAPTPPPPQPARPAPIAPPPAARELPPRIDQLASTAVVTPPKPSAPRAPTADLPGPSFLAALELDERLAPNQREALRMLYLQFVPGPRPNAADMSRMPADEALNEDPALGRGQRETIRSVLDRFLRKAVR